MLFLLKGIFYFILFLYFNKRKIMDKKIKDFVNELNWRGMIHDIMPKTQEMLNNEMTAGYIGFDPTADSLHIGNLVQIMTLVHFQKCGHQPIVLVGGATGMVGDPSGKSQERNLLDEDKLLHNLLCIKRQLEKFLDFSGHNAAEVVNNYDWFKEYFFLDFIRDVGKHITVNYMTAKESVKKRLESGGLSFTEFSYQLVQGYDFYYLWKNKNVKLQLGGSDQWGNIVTGTELIRRKGNGEAYALTTPLITQSDGSKFGKTAEGNIWLDAEKTSPYQFYQYWLNSSDEDAEKFIRIFTFLDKKTITSIIHEHQQAPHKRLLQTTLAKDITERVHSQKELNMAIKASNILFGKSTVQDLENLEEKIFLQIFDGVPLSKVSKTVYHPSTSIVDLLSVITQGTIFKSKGEAKRMIAQKSVNINHQKILSVDESITNYSLLQDKYLLVQKGKKNYYVIILQ